MSRGHATPEEIREVEELERVIDFESSSIEDLLKLGQLYIEPCHEEEKAIEVFEAILKRDPGNVWAKYWIAYCCVNYLMDEDSLKRAKDLLDSCLSDVFGKGNAAVYLLLVRVIDELHYIDKKYRISEKEKLNLLEESVRLEPNWVSNRMNLAWLYKKLGRIDDAIYQIEKALENFISPESGWSTIQYYFEDAVTWRVSESWIEDFQKELEELKNKKVQGKLTKLIKNFLNKLKWRK